MPQPAPKVVLDHAEEIFLRRADSDLVETGRHIGLDGIERAEYGRGLRTGQQPLLGQHDGVRVIDAHELAPMVPLHVFEQRPKHCVPVNGRGESGSGHSENVLPRPAFSQPALTWPPVEARARAGKPPLVPRRAAPRRSREAAPAIARETRYAQMRYASAGVSSATCTSLGSSTTGSRASSSIVEVEVSLDPPQHIVPDDALIPEGDHGLALGTDRLGPQPPVLQDALLVEHTGIV